MRENVTISVMGFIHCNETSTDNLTNGVLVLWMGIYTQPTYQAADFSDKYWPATDISVSLYMLARIH